MIIANKQTGVLVIDPSRILIDNDNYKRIIARQTCTESGAVIAYCPTKESAMVLFNDILMLLLNYDQIVLDGDKIYSYGKRGNCHYVMNDL